MLEWSLLGDFSLRLSLANGETVAPLSTNRIAWLYTDDSGTTYRVNAQKALTDQAVLGGSASTGFEPQLPLGTKMRRGTGRSAGGVSRSFVLYDGTQTFASASAPGTINANVLENSTVFTSDGTVIPEKRARRSATHQTA